MKLSIIIVHFNTPELTRACLSSIYKNAPSVPFEVILVDNGSHVGDIQQVISGFSNLHLISNKSNAGFAKGCNTGIAKAQGSLICLLNSDTEVPEGTFNHCVQILEKEKKTGVVTCQLKYKDGKIQHNCQCFPSIGTELLELTRIFKLLPEKWMAALLKGAFFDHQYRSYGGWVWGTFFLFRKDDLKKLTGAHLSDRFFMYGEDMEWCYQFKKAGMDIKFDPAVYVIHHAGGSEYGNSIEKTAQIIKNELLWMENEKGGIYLWLFKKLRYWKYRSLRKKNPKLGELADHYR